MAEAKQARQKAGLAEEGSSFGNRAKKEGACAVEARSSDMGRIERCNYLLEGENLCGQSSAEVEACQRTIKEVFLKYIDGNRQCKNNIIPLQDDGHLKNRKRTRQRCVMHSLCLKLFCPCFSKEDLILHNILL